MRMARSLRFRLFVFAVAVVAVAMVAAGLGLTALFARHLERRVGQELDTHLQQLVGAIRFDGAGRMSLEREPSDPRFTRVLGGLYWQVEDAAGGQRLSSRSLWNETLALPPGPVAPGAARVRRIPGPDGAALLVHERAVIVPVAQADRLVRVGVAIDRGEIDVLRRGFARDLAPALGVLGVVLLAGFAVQIGAGLRPLDTVRAALGRVRAGTARRLEADGPAEVAPLVAEVNSLLEAQEREIARARDRAADLAHGLKTPLTALAADIERLREKGETALARDIGELAQRMGRHMDRELARARIRHGRPSARPLVARVAADIVRTLERTPDGARVRFDNAAPPDMAVAVDPQDLAELLGNLIENAARHAGSLVRVTARRERGRDLLAVEDDGPGLADPDRARAVLRGVRLDVAGAGAGLGLAIVRDIADAYGGELRLERSSLGGLSAEVELPAAAGG